MALDYSGLPLPKPTPLRKVKARKAREDAKRIQAFVDAVWDREALKVDNRMGDVARCQVCGVFVHRWHNDCTGDVHHRIGRRAKATRYDPENGVLLCNVMRNDCHGKVQRHEVECP